MSVSIAQATGQSYAPPCLHCLCVFISSVLRTAPLDFKQEGHYILYINK